MENLDSKYTYKQPPPQPKRPPPIIMKNDTVIKSSILSNSIDNNKDNKEDIKDNKENLEKDNTEKQKEIELSLQDISINLRLISKIEVGDKLYINDKYVSIDNSYFPSVTRWFRGLNRNNNIDFINLILTKGYKFNDSILLEKPHDYSQIIFGLTNDFKNSINGLLNLKQTYCSDKLIQSELDVIVENIRNKIESNYKKLNFSK
jgi:hypothetical protein